MLLQSIVFACRCARVQAEVDAGPVDEGERPPRLFSLP